MSMSIIARHRAALREETIGRLRAHPPRAERVLLFGSLARGDFDGASDDILVIGGALPGSAIHAAAGREVDTLLWTQEQWERAIARRNPFALGIVREGVELWPGR
jgi:predicted nucleotidyltransferase